MRRCFEEGQTTLLCSAEKKLDIDPMVSWEAFYTNGESVRLWRKAKLSPFQKMRPKRAAAPRRQSLYEVIGVYNACFLLHRPISAAVDIGKRYWTSEQGALFQGL